MKDFPANFLDISPAIFAALSNNIIKKFLPSFRTITNLPQRFAIMPNNHLTKYAEKRKK